MGTRTNLQRWWVEFDTQDFDPRRASRVPRQGWKSRVKAHYYKRRLSCSRR
jgi:hypothetical protein